MRLLALIALFILVPLSGAVRDPEGGGRDRVVWTILLLAADSVIGSLLLRSQGRAAWSAGNEALAQGRMPHQEVQDGVLVILAAPS